MTRPDVAIVCAADAQYFPLLKDLVESIRADRIASGFALAVLDLGLSEENRAWLSERGATLKEPGWDIDFPGRRHLPSYFRAMIARPFLPRYFPGYAVYLWIDSDAWIQDGQVLEWYVRAARKGLLAVTPELDRAYSSTYKRPKLFGWGQNFKAYRAAFGWRVADRLARNPILNSGVFALAADAPHWQSWARTAHAAYNRPRLRRPGRDNMPFFLIDQTTFNYTVFGDNLPATFLPAVANWFCGKGTPWYDRARRCFVEPHEPHTPLGILHLAGDRIQDKVFAVPTTDGDTIMTRLTYSAFRALADKGDGDGR